MEKWSHCIKLILHSGNYNSIRILVLLHQCRYNTYICFNSLYCVLESSDQLPTYYASNPFNKSLLDRHTDHMLNRINSMVPCTSPLLKTDWFSTLQISIRRKNITLHIKHQRNKLSYLSETHTYTTSIITL